MASREDIFRFLSGGITALVPDEGGDGGKPRQGTEASPTERPEQTPPEPQLKDREAFLQTVTQPQILIGTVILIALVGALAFARR